MSFNAFHFFYNDNSRLTINPVKFFALFVWVVFDNVVAFEDTAPILFPCIRVCALRSPNNHTVNDKSDELLLFRPSGFTSSCFWIDHPPVDSRVEIENKPLVNVLDRSCFSPPQPQLGNPESCFLPPVSDEWLSG